MLSKQKINALSGKIDALLMNMLENERKHLTLLKSLGNKQISGINLLHYLALRTYDLRDIQKALASIGISSQSHAEGYTLNNLQKIRFLLKSLSSQNTANDAFDHLDHNESNKITNENAAILFGKAAYSGQTK